MGRNDRKGHSQLLSLRSITRATKRGCARREGFSLVELLVAAGVIALLLGILLPVLGRARRSAHSVICMNNLKTFGVSSTAYAMDYGGVLPWEGYAEGDRPIRHLGPWNEPSTWFNAIPKYANQPTYYQLQQNDASNPLPRSGDKSIFVCPDAGDPSPGSSEDVIVDGYFMFWGLDTGGAPVQRKTYWCYGYNTKLDAGREDRNLPYRVTIPISKLKKPSETVFIAEKLMSPNENLPPDDLFYGNQSVGQQEISYREFAARHSAGGYILFVDGHVALFSRHETQAVPTAVDDNFNQPGKLIWDPRY